MRIKSGFLLLLTFSFIFYTIKIEAQSTYKFHKYEIFAGSNITFSSAKKITQQTTRLVLVDYPNILWAKKTFNRIASFSYKPRVGIDVGLRRNYELNKRLLMGVSFLLNYKQVSRIEKYDFVKIDSVKAENVNVDQSNDSWRLYYNTYFVGNPPESQKIFHFVSVDFPVTFNKFLSKRKFSADFEVAPSIILSSRYQNLFVYDPERNTETAGKANASFNLFAGTGLSYYVNNRITLELSFKYGFFNLYKISEHPLRLQSVSLRLRTGIND